MPNESELRKLTWAEETMEAINKLTPDVKGKAFDPDWFLLRQRLEQFESSVAARVREARRDEARYWNDVMLDADNWADPSVVEKYIKELSAPASQSAQEDIVPEDLLCPDCGSSGP